MNQEQGGDTLDAIADAIAMAATTTVQRGLALAKERADWWSSGPYSLAFLRRAGHPYARRRPQARFDPGRINVQTGLGGFRGAWVTEGPAANDDGGIGGRIWNADPKARWLEEGTDRMVPRPLAERVMADIQPRLVELWEQELAAALRRIRRV